MQENMETLVGVREKCTGKGVGGEYPLTESEGGDQELLDQWATQTLSLVGNRPVTNIRQGVVVINSVPVEGTNKGKNRYYI